MYCCDNKSHTQRAFIPIIKHVINFFIECCLCKVEVIHLLQIFFLEKLQGIWRHKKVMNQKEGSEAKYGFRMEIFS